MYCINSVSLKVFTNAGKWNKHLNEQLSYNISVIYTAQSQTLLWPLINFMFLNLAYTLKRLHTIQNNFLRFKNG